MDRFTKLGNVSDAYPQVSAAARIKASESSIDGVVYGKNNDYLRLEGVRLASGRQYEDNSLDEALINLAAQRQLSIADNNILGKDISVDVVIRSESLAQGSSVKTVSKDLKIVGVIDDASAPFIYVPLHIFTDNGVVNYTNAKVKMDTKDDVDQAKLQIENMGFNVTSIKETIDQINQFFAIFQVILISFGGIAIIVACLGMFNTLTISLIEKTREVGFMKALGTMRSNIYWLFTLESMLIGLFGSVAGVTVGLAAGKILNYGILALAKGSGNQAVELFYIPISIVLFVLFISLAISLFTGLYPARRAAKISALDAMRYE
jgi:putative ABC transport system permease protein